VAELLDDSSDRRVRTLFLTLLPQYQQKYQPGQKEDHFMKGLYYE
jgi:hypothetical protein